MLFRILDQRLPRHFNGWLIFIIVTVIAIAIGALKIGAVRSFNLVIGSIFILFSPGWWLSFITFPLNDRLNNEAVPPSRRTLDVIERLTLAVALSIIISSLTVFVLYNFPEGSKLIPKNFIVATGLLNILLFAAAAWRKKWISFISALVLGIFPFVVTVLNQVFDIAITTRNFISAVLVVCFVLIVARIITKKRS